MPYKLGDRTLPLDVAWEHNSVQYPANWLRLSTEEDRTNLGIIWEASSVQSWDQRFYWGYDADGNLIPKDYAGLSTLWINQTKDTANKLLAPSDWRVIKAKERGTTLNAEWKTWRQTIRTECGTKVAAIEATASIGDLAPHVDIARVQALAEYVTGSDYFVWSPNPDAPDFAAVAEVEV